MDESKVWLGTGLKFRVEIQAGGFSMEDDDFTVEIRRGRTSRVFAKDDLVTDGDGNWYVCFDTRDFGAGLYQIITTASVPDTDFPGGIRTEVNRADLIRVEGV